MLVTYDLKLEEFTVVSYRCQLQMLVTDVSHICFSHMLVTEYKLSRTQKKMKIVTNRQFCLTSNQLSYLSLWKDKLHMTTIILTYMITEG